MKINQINLASRALIKPSALLSFFLVAILIGCATPEPPIGASLKEVQGVLNGLMECYTIYPRSKLPLDLNGTNFRAFVTTYPGQGNICDDRRYYIFNRSSSKFIGSTINQNDLDKLYTQVDVDKEASREKIFADLEAKNNEKDRLARNSAALDKKKIAELRAYLATQAYTSIPPKIKIQKTDNSRAQLQAAAMLGSVFVATLEPTKYLKIISTDDNKFIVDKVVLNGRCSHEVGKALDLGASFEVKENCGDSIKLTIYTNRGNFEYPVSRF